MSKTTAHDYLFETYWPLIKKVSRQVAHQSNARYGFVIVGYEDLAQDVFVRLAEEGIDLDTMNEPQAWVRETARIKALDTIHSTLRRRKQKGEGGGLVEPSDLVAEANSPKHVSDWGVPEDATAFEASVTECEEVVQRIIGKPGDLDQRDALEAFYVRGEGGDAKERKRRSRAEKELLPEDLASLQVWRAWNFPELRNRTPKTEATPLLAVLLS